MRKKPSTTDRAKKAKTSRKLLDLPSKTVKGETADNVKGGIIAVIIGKDAANKAN